MVMLRSNAFINALRHRLLTGLGMLGLGLVLTLTSALPSIAHADALAQVNRTTVVESGTVTLRVRTRDIDQDIDLTPLEQDFTVESQGHSTNNPALTGLGTEFQEWEIVLSPRRTGELVIPALTVGDARTQPIEIRVLPVSPEQQAVMDRDVYLEVDIASESLYVGEPVLVQLTLFYNVNVDGTFADVTPGDSEWEPLGDGSTGTIEQDGSNYNYTRFQYLYTPLSSGPRELPAFEFEGDYRTNRLAPRMPLTDVRSDPIPLTVKPIPDEFPDGHPWLPARNLSLEQTWSQETDTYQAGDQINRELRIEATGPAASNLPSVLSNLTTGAGINSYPNPAQTNDQIIDENRIAERRESTAYLLVAGGEHTLPEVRVPWWDLDSDALRWAEAPGQSFSVQDALAPVDIPAPPDRAAEPPVQTDDNWLRWSLAIGGFAVAIAAIWWLGRRLPRRIKPLARWLWFLATLPVQLLWRLLAGLTSRFVWPWVAPMMRLPVRLLLRLNNRLPKWPQRFRHGQTDHPRHTNAGPSATEPDQVMAPPLSGRPRQDSTKQWTQAVTRAAQAQDWKALLDELQQQLKPYGWPDTQSIETTLGIQGLTSLVRQTQRCLYGPAWQPTDEQQLAAEWEALLTRWPDRPGRSKQQRNAPGLYPDQD